MNAAWLGRHLALLRANLMMCCFFPAGPVTPPEGPAEPAPGSAVWEKEGTRPGGAAAAPAGSADDDVGQAKDTSSKEAPDPSKILPSHEKGVAGAKMMVTCCCCANVSPVSQPDRVV